MAEQRESIKSHLGFLMLAAGCAVGLGNVWRFPFITGNYGGGCFVVLYLFFLLLLGLPVMMMELAIGRAARRGIFGAMRDLPEKNGKIWQIPGGIAFAGNLVLMLMYTTVTGWMIAYFVKALSGDLMLLDTSAKAAEHFLDFQSQPVSNCVYMLLTTFIGALVCAMGLRNGVERITKFLMGGLFLMLGGLCVYALLLPGAKAGLQFYLLPDWSRMTSFSASEVVLAAMGQAFFTLSLGVGSIAIFGSYVDKSRSLLRESVSIIFFDTLVALLAGVVVFSACFSYEVEVSSGPGLVMVVLSSVFSHLPGGRFWGGLFFLFLSIAALTTVIAVMENLVAFLIDERKWSRVKASVFIGLLVAVGSLPCAFSGSLLKDWQIPGIGTIMDFEDWLVSENLLPLGALAIIIFCSNKFGWGWKNFLTEVNTGTGRKLPDVCKHYCRFILPVLVVIIFLAGMINRFCN